MVKNIHQCQNNKMKIIPSKYKLFMGKTCSINIYLRIKPLVPERDSSLYECFSTSQSPQVYNTFRPLNRGSPSTISVPNLSSTTNLRHNSNSSSNEADEESSLSSLNSNNVPTINYHDENNSIITSLSNMSTFKSNILPSKPSDIKKRSNNRKQIYTTLNLNNNNNTSSIINENETSTPPPPPPFPPNLDLENENKREISMKSDFQSQIEQAKSHLKKVTPNKVIVKSNPPSKYQ